MILNIEIVNFFPKIALHTDITFLNQNYNMMLFTYDRSILKLSRKRNSLKCQGYFDIEL